MDNYSRLPDGSLYGSLYTGEVQSDGLPKILPPCEDGVFKAILTLPEAHVALVRLVAAILGRPVRTVLLRNNDAPSRDAQAKQEEFDINCVVDSEDGDQFAFEMQASQMKGDNRENNHMNIKWRSVFNLCDLHSNQPGRGLDYVDFVRSYQVMLCNYKVFDFDNDLVERFTFRNQKGRELCDAVMAMFIDLTSASRIAKKPVACMSDIECWIVFFALGNAPKYGQIIDEIAKVKEGISVAKDMLLTISQNPDERARFRSRRIRLQDREHEKAVERKEGIKEGIEKARAEYEPLLANKDAEIAGKDAEIANKDAEIACKDAEIAALRAKLNESQEPQ